MNNSDFIGYPPNDNVNGFKYFIGISVGLIMLIVTVVILSFYYTRPPSPPRQNPNTDDNNHNNHPIDVEVGLDEATLHSYPKFLYSESKLQTKETTTTFSCSICLADYNSTDIIRLLPDCGHLFHLKCVDPWLLQHPTCPICRSSPIPTPQLTPLVDVIPPANNRSDQSQIGLTIS